MNNKILIIEDDIDLCDVLVESLEDEGFIVNHLQNGISGKEELNKNPYDFLLLDIKIPGLTGFDILKWLRDTGKKVKIIILTGMPLNEELTRYLNEDDSKEAELLQYADVVLNKPINTDVIINTLKELDTP